MGPAPLAITSNDHLFGCLIIYMYTNSQCYFVHRYFNNARHNKVHSLMTTPCLTTTVTNDNASQIRILFSLLFAAAANYHNYARKCSKLLWWKLSYSLYPLRTAQHPTYHPTELPFNHPPPTHPLPNHPLPDLLILLPNHPPPTHLLATVPRPGIRKAIYSHLMSKQTPGQSRDPLRPVAALVSILTPTSTWWPESWRSGCCSAEVDWAPPRPRFTAKTDASDPPTRRPSSDPTSRFWNVQDSSGSTQDSSSLTQLPQTGVRREFVEMSSSADSDYLEPLPRDDTQHGQCTSGLTTARSS